MRPETLETWLFKAADFIILLQGRGETFRVLMRRLLFPIILSCDVRALKSDNCVAISQDTQPITRPAQESAKLRRALT
jgi:hypothetical protein